MSAFNQTPEHRPGPTARWTKKFRCAFRGIGFAVSSENSFAVHIPCAIIVMLFACWLRCSRLECSVLVLCIVIVFVAELFNTAIECLARAITLDEHPEIGRALDIASGAVLAASLTSIVIGIATFLPPISRYLSQLSL